MNINNRNINNNMANKPINNRNVIKKTLHSELSKPTIKKTNRIINYVRNIQNSLVCFASGPLSKIWIPLCMEFNPNNIYFSFEASILLLNDKVS
jgi:hypothetical protein